MWPSAVVGDVVRPRALHVRERYRIYLVRDCKRCTSVAWRHMINVRSATICPPSSLSSRWPLCCFPLLPSSISPSRPLSFSSFSTAHPFLPLPILQDHFQLLCPLHVHPCKCAHTNTVAHTHTSLSLFSHWLYYWGYFPRQCHWRRWARQGWMRRGRSLISWKPQYWHSHWLRWMNLIYLPSEAQMTSWCSSLSLSQEVFWFFFSLYAWILETHRKTSERILTETNSFCGLTWLLYIFVHIGAAPPNFYDYEIALIMGLYVCVQL